MTKDEALAFDLALEALKSCSGVPHWPALQPAITAIKKVRALDKMAENARELGLDYEPAEVLGHNGWGFPIKAAAPVQEDWGPGPHECHSLTAAPVQEPVAWRYRGILHDFDPSDWAEGPVTPLYTTTPAAQQEPIAQDVQEKCRIEAVPAKGGLLPAAPVQKPVWIRPDDLQKAQKAPFLCRVEPNKRDDFVPLYAIKDKNG